MNAEPPPRRVFQFRLTTMFVLMACVCVSMWAASQLVKKGSPILVILVMLMAPLGVVAAVGLWRHLRRSGDRQQSDASDEPF